MIARDPWILGLDLHDKSRGALAFAAWLREVGELPIVGVHILEDWVRALADEDPTPALLAEARRQVAAAGLEEIDGLEVRQAEHATAGLLAACVSAGGLVLGRAAATTSKAMFRLGRVARRVLRRLPCPVVVVPPDLTSVDIGPILLATDLGPASEAATRFARELAVRCGHSVELMHVGEDRYGDLIDELQPGWLAARERLRAATREAVDRWAAAHDLGAVTRHVIHGDPIEAIITTATHRRAAMVVVGSRHLSAAGRVFSGSTASALAAFAGCPVCVVPQSGEAL